MRALMKILLLIMSIFISTALGVIWYQFRTTSTVQPLPSKISLKETYLPFRDDVLGIEFFYPKSWGTIEGELRCLGNTDTDKKNRNFGTGCSYGFSFVNQGAYNESKTGKIRAGGRSNDFAQGRGAYLIDDTREFQGKSPEDICQSLHASVCVPVNSRVISMIIIPKYEDICPPGPGEYVLSKIVTVDLGNKKVNSLLFEYTFLSENTWKELYGLLGENYENCYVTDEGTQKTFDDKAYEILKRIIDRSIDRETLNNIDEFDHFVNSIKFL